MSGLISRQPNGLLCRHSTVTDCVTDYNMTEEDYINLCKERAAEEAKEIIEKYMKDFSEVKERFRPTNMTAEEFQQILLEMKLPKELCRHTTTQEG